MTTYRPLAVSGFLTALLVTMVAASGAALSLPAPTSAAPTVQSDKDKDDKDKDDKDKDDKDKDDDDGDGNWKDGKLVLLTSRLPTMLPGQQGWVGLNWTATSNVCDIEVTATAPGVTISYPENTGKFSSLYVRDALAETNLDFTALNISVSPTVKGPVTVSLRATYTRLQPGKIKKTDDLTYKSVDCTKGSPGGVTTSAASLPIDSPTGAKATLKTPSVVVPASTPTWVDLGFTTNYAGLEDFRVTLKPPSGLEVVYPGDKTSSGLANGSALPVGGTDTVAVRLDAAGLKSGSYQVPIQATWTGGSVDTDLKLTVK